MADADKLLRDYYTTADVIDQIPRPEGGDLLATLRDRAMRGDPKAAALLEQHYGAVRSAPAWSSTGIANAPKNFLGRVLETIPPELITYAQFATPGAKPTTQRARKGQTVSNPYRAPEYPGIYENPREMVAKAEANVAPESEWLKKVFGVNRGDLDEMGGKGQRKGNVAPEEILGGAGNPRGAKSAEGVMTPKNTQRLVDILAETQTNAPKLTEGMRSWYVMDPAYQRLVQIVGPEEAGRLYTRLNTVMGMMSPGAPVTTEIQRGLLANHLWEKGRPNEFVKHGGSTEAMKENLGVEDVRGHAYHKTAQGGPFDRYVQTGDLPKEPKVPLYIYASGTPETGFQTAAPVPDAHWSRLVGLADTRKGPTDIGASASHPEMSKLAPWWRDRVAGATDLEAVPAQAMVWGAGSHATGVDTPIGKPKLEMLAERIAERAAKEGVPLEVMRDRILTGDAYASGGGVEAVLAQYGKKGPRRG
jgi:hypothetical protein